MLVDINRVACRRAEVAEDRAPFLEYADSIDFDPCFQSFDKEIADVFGYGPPAGEVLLAAVDKGACETKRLHVCPRNRCRAIGLKDREAPMPLRWMVGGFSNGISHCHKERPLISRPLAS